MDARRYAPLMIVTLLGPMSPLLGSCAGSPPPPPEPRPAPPVAAPQPVAPRPAGPTVAQAVRWIQLVDGRLKKLWEDRERISWVNQTYLTHDTDLLVAQALRLTPPRRAGRHPRPPAPG